MNALWKTGNSKTMKKKGRREEEAVSLKEVCRLSSLVVALGRDISPVGDACSTAHLTISHVDSCPTKKQPNHKPLHTLHFLLQTPIL